MFGTFALNSRLLVVICAAAVVLVACSHAAKAASPTIATGYIRIKNNFLTRLNAPYSQQTSLSAGLLSKEGDVQTATDTRWRSRDTPSTVNHEPRPLPYTQGSFSFGQNSQDATQPRVRITKVRSGGVKPGSNVFTRSLQHGGNGFSGWPSRKQDHSLPLKEKIGNPLNSNYLSQKRDYKYSKDSNRELDIPTRHLVPSQTRRLSTQPLNPIKRYSDYKETNQPQTVRVQSGSIGRNQVLHFRSHPVPPEASLTRRDPSVEKLTSVPDFSHNQISVSNREVLGFKNVQSYLFKDSPTQSNEVMDDGLEDRQMDAAKYESNPFGEKEKSRFGSDLKQPANPIIQNSISQKESFTRHRTRMYPPQHDAAPPKDAPVEGRNPEGFVPTVRLNSKDNSPSKSFAPLDRFNSASRKPEQSHKPGQPIQRISRLRGFTNSVKQPGKEPPVSERSQQSSLDKGMNNGFRFVNPHLSLKNSFGPRGVSASAPASEKPQRMDSTSPSPSVQASSTPGPLITWFKTTELPESRGKVGVDRNDTQIRLSLYKGKFSLKGFGTQPLEGAKVLPQGPDVSTKPDFKGFNLRSSLARSPKRIRIQRRYNQAGETQPGANSSGGGESKPHTKISKGDGSVPRSMSNEVTDKTQTFQILRPGKDRSGLVQSKTNWRYSNQSPAVASSSHLRPGGNLRAAPKPESEPKEASRNQLVPDQRIKFQTATSSTVRGARVKQSSSQNLIVINATRNAPIIRQPRVKADTYADIVGSASFSSIQAKSFPPADREYFPNMTRTEQNTGWTLESSGGRNTSRSLQEYGENDLEAFQSIDKSNFGKNDETDNDIKISGLFFDSEGSGSGDFNLSNVLSTAKERQAAGRDLLELDYLRKSTENVFFKSVRRPGVDQRGKEIEMFRDLEQI